jgi:Rrf2 family cysteine metabolism transcriptional repressor
MALMSRKVDYALVILSYLDRHPEGGCARAIADRFDLSRGFVANILKQLCHAGFVAGRRGVKGGYLLQRSMTETSLSDLMEALDNPVSLAECNGGDCPLASFCPVRGPVAEVHRRICDVLRGVTLAQLLRPGTAESLPMASVR